MNTEECWANLFWSACITAVLCTLIVSSSGCLREETRIRNGFTADGVWKAFPNTTTPASTPVEK